MPFTTITDADSFIENLGEDIKRGKSVFLVGAGISSNSGAPLVFEIYNELALALKVTPDYLLSLIRKQPFESCMSILLEDLFRNHIKKLFSQNLPTATHLLLGHLLHNGNISNVLTTNFDELIEKAFQSISNEVPNKITPANFSALSLPAGSKSIIKLHGCVTEPLDQLGITIDAVANKGNKELVETILRKIMPREESYSLVIMGYGGQDVFDIAPALQTVLEENIFIYHVNHRQEKNKFEVKTLSGPYETFQGKELICNTDELVKIIWPTTVQAPYRENPTTLDRNGWKRAFAHWKEQIRKYRCLKELEVLGHLAFPSNLRHSIHYGRRALHVLERNDHFGHPHWTALVKNQLAQRLRESVLETVDKSVLNEAAKLGKESVEFYETDPQSIEMLKLLSEQPFYEKHAVRMAKDYGKALGAYGLVLRLQGHHNEALRIYDKAMEVHKLSGDNEEKGGTLMNIGYIFAAHKDPQQAVQHYADALKINDRYPRQLPHCYLGLCEAHIRASIKVSNSADRIKHLQQAHDAARASLKWARDLGYGDIEKLAFDKMRRIDQTLSMLTR